MWPRFVTSTTPLRYRSLTSSWPVGDVATKAFPRGSVVRAVGTNSRKVCVTKKSYTGYRVRPGSIHQTRVITWMTTVWPRFVTSTTPLRYRSLTSSWPVGDVATKAFPPGFVVCTVGTNSQKVRLGVVGSYLLSCDDVYLGGCCVHGFVFLISCVFCATLVLLLVVRKPSPIILASQVTTYHRIVER